jgi:hypothetical protein
MNHTPDATAPAGNGGTFDPQQAAALLGQTTRQARRQLEPTPPWWLMTRGVLGLCVLGAVWLTVRGQHPFRGPTVADIPVCIAFGLLNLCITLAIRARRTAGIAGRSRLHPAEIAILAGAWVCPFVVMAALASAGVSDSIVYGWYPVTVPLIVAGLAWTAVAARRAQWLSSGTGIAVAVTGAVGLAAGPAGAWLVAGVGLCATLVGHAAVISWQQRA